MRYVPLLVRGFAALVGSAFVSLLGGVLLALVYAAISLVVWVKWVSL